MTTFLRLSDGVATNALNVVSGSFKEEPLKWQGEPGRAAFDGTILSTARDPRRTWSCQVEFLTLSLYEAFLTFVSTGRNVFTGRLTGIRVMLLTSLGGDGAVTVGQPVRVLPELGQAEAFEYVEAGSIIVGRRLDLTLREV